MFMTPAQAEIIIALKFLIGAIIGLVVAALVYRSRFRRNLALRAALFAGIAFLLASGVAGWADSKANYSNYPRIDTAPDGESLWLVNLIAEHEVALTTLSSGGAALLAGFRFRPSVHR